MSKVEKDLELVAAHISHDAYGHKFNSEGHVYDVDLFYDMKQPLYSPLVGWSQHEMDLKQIKHRPLLPGKLEYYGLKPFSGKIFLISLVGKSLQPYIQPHTSCTVDCTVTCASKIRNL